MEAGAVHIIGVRDAFEAQLVLKQVAEEAGKASGGQRLPASIIDPGPVMRVEPAVLVLIGIALVQLVGAPDIDDRQWVSLGIRTGIEYERLVGPLSGQIGVDQALCPSRLEASRSSEAIKLCKTTSKPLEQVV